MAIAKRLENEHLSRSLCPVAAEAKNISTSRQTWCRPPPELQLAKFPEPEAKYLHAPSSCLSALQIFYSLSLYINVNETITGVGEPGEHLIVEWGGHGKEAAAAVLLHRTWRWPGCLRRRDPQRLSEACHERWTVEEAKRSDETEELEVLTFNLLLFFYLATVLSDEKRRRLYDAGLYDPLLDDEEEVEKQYSIEELQQMLPEMAQDFGSPSRPCRSVDRGFSRASKWFADDMGREARRKTRLHHPGVELFGSVSH
ncbi:hypothetical protein BHE74_00024839 [Ensete ventricosum]|nr:hypothetical protein BHE74_00024839 [Ensete ventricosum]